MDNPEGLDTKAEIFQPVLPTQLQLVVLKHRQYFNHQGGFTHPFIIDQYWRRASATTANGLGLPLKNVCCLSGVEMFPMGQTVDLSSKIYLGSISILNDPCSPDFLC